MNDKDIDKLQDRPREVLDRLLSADPWRPWEEDPVEDPESLLNQKNGGKYENPD